MRKNTLLSIIIVTLSIIFVSCSSEGNSYSEKTLVDDLVEKNLLVIIGEFSDDAPKHTLAKLKGDNKKGEMYTNLSPEPELSYEFEYDKEKKTWYLGASVNGGSPFYISLYKKCAEEGKCIFLGKNIHSGKVVRTFIPMPAGYEHIIKAQNLAVEGGSSELIAKNCTEAIEKASVESGDYSRFVKIKAARLLLEETSEFLLARKTFEELGMKKKMAEAEIMFIAKGEAVAAEDINGTAKLAWESIQEDNSYNQLEKYESWEAVAYACAKVGVYEEAYKYADLLSRSAQINAFENKKQGIYFDINRMISLTKGYEEKLVPKAFQASVLNNTVQN